MNLCKYANDIIICKIAVNCFLLILLLSAEYDRNHFTYS